MQLIRPIHIILACLALIFSFIMFAAVKFNLSQLQLLLMIGGVFAVSGIIFFVNKVVVHKEIFNWLKFFGYFVILSVFLPLIMITSLSFLSTDAEFSAISICVLIAFFIFAVTLKIVWYSPKTSKETKLALLFSLIFATLFIFLTRPELLFHNFGRDLK